MILAAGRGERMRPLTDNCPKPLLKVGGKSLLVWHLENLHSAGIREVVINTSYMADKIHTVIGDGSEFGLQIQYSDEQPRPLETLGGILHALPLLGTRPFVLINGDVWTDVPLAELCRLKVEQAHLLLAKNPDHHPEGDFSLHGSRLASPRIGEQTFTYTGIGIFHSDFFAGLTDTGKPQPLAPLLFSKARQCLITAQCMPYRWFDVGTPERLKVLDTALSGSHW